MEFSGVRAAVLDIEGTVGSISYVKEVLFGYARSRYGTWYESLPQAERDQLDVDVVAQLEKWTDDDVKHPLLKSVQAQIWHAGFVDGQLRGSVYADVEPALQRWRDSGIAVYIYSSGSVAAQKDWFGYSERGDLTPLLDGYFDLDNTGPKKEVDSYTSIAESIGLAPEAIVFFSDVVDELVAAEKAGIRTIHVIRDGQPAQADRPTISDFTDVTLSPTPRGIK